MTKHFRTMFPLLESSLQVRLDIMNLILAESELITDHFSNSDILLPPVYDVGEILLLCVFHLPSYDVFAHQATCVPIDPFHVLLNLILPVMFLTHELLKVFDFTLSFPVLCSFWTCKVIIIQDFCSIVSPPPILKGFPDLTSKDSSKQRLQSIVFLNLGSSIIFPFEECILQSTDVRLFDHAMNIHRTLKLVITL